MGKGGRRGKKSKYQDTLRVTDGDRGGDGGVLKDLVHTIV